MSFIENVFNNLNPILIGRYFNISDVGIFTRAQSITCVPRNLLQGTFVKFSFPFFSKNQHDLEIVKNYYFAFVWLSCSLLILCMGGLFLLGDPTKAKEKLGWVPEVKFEELVKIMIEGDLRLLDNPNYEMGF